MSAGAQRGRTLRALLVCTLLGAALTLLLLPLLAWVGVLGGTASTGLVVPALLCFAASTAALFLFWRGASRRRH